MTPQEFKAWFEGYSEGVEDRPTKKQWERIQARVAEIDGKPTTHTVWVDRYWPGARPWWDTLRIDASPRWVAAGVGVQTITSTITPSGTTIPCSSGQLWNGPVNHDGRPAQISSYVARTGGFEPTVAFNALGRADALADVA